MAFDVVHRLTARGMCQGVVQTADRKRCGPDRMARLQRHAGVGRARGEILKDRNGLLGRIKRAASPLKQPEAPERHEQVRRAPKAAAQLNGAFVVELHFRFTPPADRHQHARERDAQLDFAFVSLARPGQPFEERQGSTKLSFRGEVRTPTSAGLGRALKVSDSARDVARLGEVGGELRGNVERAFAIPTLEAFADFPVQLDSARRQELLREDIGNRRQSRYTEMRLSTGTESRKTRL
jgi:hypothetical protein